MSSYHRTPWIRLLFSILAALFLTTLPIDKDWQWMQPQWFLLVVIYWGFALPDKFGILTAWVVGLLLDCVGSGLIGLHALGMAMIAHLVHLLHLRIRTFPAWQKAVVVFIFIGLYQTVLRLILAALGYPTPDGLFYYLSSITSLIAWPIIVWLLAPSIKKNRYN